MIKSLLFFCYLFFIAGHAFAQPDNYPGTWQMNYQPFAGKAIQIELQVASAESNLLYPARLSIQGDSFTAVYELLLVKKNSRELGISKNKYARTEKPFSIGTAPFFFNGILDLSRDLKGQPTLTINRIQQKLTVAKADTASLPKVHQQLALQIINLLKDGDIKLTKINGIPLRDGYADRITSPALSPAYFGILDTVMLKTRTGFVRLSGAKKGDVVSVTVNGKMLSDRIELSKKQHIDDLVLDTGLNLVVLFADNFSNDLPSKGRMELEFGAKKINVDFANKGDSAASFIIAKLYCEHDRDKEVGFRGYNPFGPGEKPLQQNERLLGSLLSNSKELTLAIWDDAVEDGDSVSININGNWIAKGFPVKKNTQYLKVVLKPGPNTITFSADNLGSIPPNTSIIEIIDGKRRKSFTLETILGESNLIKVMYEVRPD